MNAPACLISALSVLALLSGCAGQRTFATAARAGDTIGVPIGWAKNASRQNVTVVVTGSDAVSYTFVPGDPSVRAVANMYPDPASRLLVGTETNQSLGVDANGTGALVAALTNNDKEISQTTVLLNLPATLAVGTASIVVKDQNGASFTGQPILVEILPGAGSANPFQQNNSSSTLSPGILASLERAETRTITFSGPSVPYGIQVELARTPGAGQPWIVNPRGDVKNISWSDNGAAILLLLTPSNGVNLTDLIHFKFYVAGGVTGLSVSSVRAFDVNGNGISGVTAQINN
jgi:hypothetical protein